MGTALQPVTLSTPAPQSSTSPPVKMAQQIRQNYHEDCEALVNKQINMELYAGYVYIAIANYFNRVDQALPGFACFFKKSSIAVLNHGDTLMEYQTKRGGKVVLQDITKPTRMEWSTPMEAMTAVLEMEKTAICTLQVLQTLAIEKKDFHLVDFIQKEFLAKKVNIIKDRELKKMIMTQTVVNLKTLVSTMKDTVQGEVLGKQVEIIKEITDCLATIKMI